jgi:hypothetical protein
MTKRNDDPKRWSQNVKTVSTFPPKSLFTKDAETVAKVMATKKVSPKGLGSAIRMVQFYINRAGKTLPSKQKRGLEEAKQILQERARRQKPRRARPATRARQDAESA